MKHMIKVWIILGYAKDKVKDPFKTGESSMNQVLELGMNILF